MPKPGYTHKQTFEVGLTLPHQKKKPDRVLKGSAPDHIDVENVSPSLKS